MSVVCSFRCPISLPVASGVHESAPIVYQGIKFAALNSRLVRLRRASVFQLSLAGTRDFKWDTFSW
jgi:hypothetical protein